MSGYQELRYNDVIKAGDEYWCESNMRWLPVHEFFVGRPAGPTKLVIRTHVPELSVAQLLTELRDARKKADDLRELLRKAVGVTHAATSCEGHQSISDGKICSYEINNLKETLAEALALLDSESVSLRAIRESLHQTGRRLHVANFWHESAEHKLSELWGCGAREVMS